MLRDELIEFDVMLVKELHLPLIILGDLYVLNAQTKVLIVSYALQSSH